MSKISIRIGIAFVVSTLLILLQGENLIGLSMLFGALLIHEVSHILTADLFDYQASELRLTFFGGRIALDSLFEIDPQAELLIAVSGPLINWLMVIGVFYLRLLGFNNLYLDCWQNYNLLIGAVNLIPALPLDGGRIIHAILNQFLGVEKSFQRMKHLSLFVALCLLGFGLVKIFRQAGGALYLLTAGLIIYNIFQIHPPHLELLWKQQQRKLNLLEDKGSLKLKPVLVRPEASIWEVLKKYGSNEYLLFFISNRRSGLTIVKEDLAWDSLINKGFKATFRETLNQQSKSVSLQKTGR
ncbi:MAG TPA: hypothetical protein PLZ08_10505 [Bacillota bacterium]|nr:hypothetical protein [Bacillota bacterium]HOL10431.1 hypothetical protein [Bacillota bacterium]HPO98369.1 hypothetical protein [Bacillota bacterium]